VTGETDAFGRPGPAILAVDPWAPGNPVKGEMRQLLTDEERAELAALTSVVRFKKGEKLFRSGERAHWIFNIVSGVVKTCAGDDERQIVAFLFPGDLSGLSSEGIYINSVQAITPVTAYQAPVAELRTRFANNARLRQHVIYKLFQELRRAQYHAVLLGQKTAVSKIATFLQMLEEHERSRGEHAGEIHMPMDRSDIADYVGMTLPAVSRTFAALIKRGVITSRDRRHVTITDLAAFEKMVAVGAARDAGLP
jgi:CRP-like cAMP-binding protein